MRKMCMYEREIYRSCFIFDFEQLYFTAGLLISDYWFIEVEMPKLGAELSGLQNMFGLYAHEI